MYTFEDRKPCDYRTRDINPQLYALKMKTCDLRILINTNRTNTNQAVTLNIT